MADVVVQLGDAAQSFVDERVNSGQFGSSGEFIASLVEEARHRAAVERVDKLLLEGLASGPGEEATPEWWTKTREEWKQSRQRAAAP